MTPESSETVPETSHTPEVFTYILLAMACEEPLLAPDPLSNQYLLASYLRRDPGAINCQNHFPALKRPSRVVDGSTRCPAPGDETAHASARQGSHRDEESRRGNVCSGQKESAVTTRPAMWSCSLVDSDLGLTPGAGASLITMQGKIRNPAPWSMVSASRNFET